MAVMVTTPKASSSNFWVGPMDPTQQWYHLPSLVKSNIPGPVWVTNPELIEYKNKARHSKE